MRLILTLIALILSLPTLAAAAEPAECWNWNEIQVQYVFDPAAQLPAQAMSSDEGPIIRVSPAQTNIMPEVVRQFHFLQECAHHVLAHEPNGVGTEVQADCWAVAEMTKRGMLNPFNYPQLLDWLREFSPASVDWAFASYRVYYIEQC